MQSTISGQRLAVQSLAAYGSSGLLVEIECHVSNNLPTIVIVGFANKAVDEAKERIRGAFATSRLNLPRKRITINLAPADLPKADSGFDLAIAVAILQTSEQNANTASVSQAFIGELGLDGSVRAVRGIIGKLLAGRALGINEFFVPLANLHQAQLVPGISVRAVGSLRALYEHLTDVEPLPRYETGVGQYSEVTGDRPQPWPSLSEIAGQAQAKRALEIAAAGGHNIFLSGPPGTGKSMLAKALPSILPPLTREEVLEVTHLHSLASHDYDQIITVRPFRAPHHSASHVAIIGGGSQARPGEISLSHRGILFFDELPEFGRANLEALRQPLEDRVISVARARDSVQYQADFMLVATANPCPCGYYGTTTECRCLQHQIQRYQARLSGPIIDRIDLFCDVHEVDHDRLLLQQADPATDTALRQRISAARARQARRYGGSKLNSGMTNGDIRRFARLTTEATALLNAAARQHHLSARSYMRIIKIARSIADLNGQRGISAEAISEALAYRRPKADT